MLAGLSATTMAPLGVDRPNASAISLETLCTSMSIQPGSRRPLLRSCSITQATSLDGMAKPRPTEPELPAGEKNAVFTPISSPAALNSGPPELP